jgi:PTH2 family peptidyl-tRNA hydrolase
VFLWGDVGVVSGHHKWEDVKKMTTEPKQVIVMRTDLGMGPGKIAAQAGHASCAFLSRILDDCSGMDRLKFQDKTYYSYEGVYLTEPAHEWMTGRFTKVCLAVDSEEELLAVHQKALDLGLESHLITDSGLTVFEGVPTRTCCGIGPDLPERINKVTGNLRLF